MQDPLSPYTPNIYPAGTPAGVHGSLPGYFPGSILPTCYPASSHVVYTRHTPHPIPRAFTRPVRPLGFTAACPALSFWLPTPDSRLPTSYSAPRFNSQLQLVTRLQPPNLLPGVLSSGLQTQDPFTLYPEHLPGWCARWGSRRLTRLHFWLPTGYPAPTSQPAKRNAFESRTRAYPACPSSA